MNVLILSYSSLSDALVPTLIEQGHQATVLDSDPDRLELLKERVKLLARNKAAITSVLTSEPLMYDYLQESGISGADAFMALSEDDHKNVLAAQIAQHIYNTAHVFCRLTDPKLRKFYSELGLNTVDAGEGSIEEIRASISQISGN